MICCGHLTCCRHPLRSKLSLDGFGLSIQFAITSIRVCWRGRLACEISRCKLPVFSSQFIHNITYSLR